MTESLIDTYVRLKRNVAEARAKVEQDPSIKNQDWLRMMVNIYNDFCSTFTENMFKAAEQTIDDTKYM